VTAEEWIRTFAEEAGCNPPTADQMDAILRLASVAAHASERKAAPIACYLAGTTDTPLPNLIAVAERLRPEATAAESAYRAPMSRSMPLCSMVIRSPSASSTSGPQSSTSRASVMSGWRTFGSS
jgi:hypothetical protein